MAESTSGVRSIYLQSAAETRRPAPGWIEWPGLFVIICFLAYTGADADLWGHVLFGRDIVAARSVPSTDPYSFTADIRWVNHEWLSEVLMWTAYRSGGAAGLVVLKLALLSVAGACLLGAWRPFALPLKWRDLLLFAIALSAWPQFATFRPQVFSVALFAVLLLVLARIYDGSSRRSWLLLPVVFAAWVNVHGGWLVGAGVLGVVVATAPFDRRFAGSRLLLAGAALPALAATLCNPYGTAMLDFLGQTVRPERADIVEWQPMTALPWIALAFWSIPAALAVIAVRRRGRDIPMVWLAVSAVLAVGSLRVARLVGFFALAVGFFLAPYIHGEPSSTGSRGAASPLRGSFAVAAMILLATVLFGRRIPAEAPWLPEPEAVGFVNRHGLEGKMLTWFDYGQYAIWHLAPHIRVSMDGRRETVYSSSMRGLHQEIYTNTGGAVKAVEALNPDYIWLPNALPVLQTLETAGWRPVFSGPRSRILARDPSIPSEAVTSMSTARRSFPGP